MGSRCEGDPWCREAAVLAACPSRSAPEMLALCLLPMESRVRLRVWMSSGGYQVGTCAHGDGFAGFGHLRASEHVLRTLRMAVEVLEVLGAR